MPQADTTQEQETLRLLRDRGPMRSKELVDAGIHYQTLSRMAQSGKITKVRRGLYQLPESAEPDDLAEAALQVPGGVICLVSALQFHELTLQMPHKTWVAIGESAHQPKITYPPVTFVRFGEQAFSLGVETHDIGDVDVRANLAAYRGIYDNIQRTTAEAVDTPSGPVLLNVTRSAAKGKIQGVEFNHQAISSFSRAASQR